MAGPEFVTSIGWYVTLPTLRGVGRVTSFVSQTYAIQGDHVESLAALGVRHSLSPTR
jgi:hypothetical protein